MSNLTLRTIEQHHTEVATMRRRMVVIDSINMNRAGPNLELEYELWRIGQISFRFVLFTIFASWIMVSRAHMTAYIHWGKDLNIQCNTTSTHHSYYDNPHCLSQKRKNLLLINAMIGSGLGALIGGWSSDMFGRTLTYRLMMPFHVLFSLIIIFVRHTAAGYICRFIITFATLAMSASCFALLIDYSSRQTRASFGALYFAYATLGYIIYGVTMKYISNWQSREIIWFCSNEIILTITAICLPESARLLATQDRKEKAWKYIRKMSKSHRREDIVEVKKLTRQEYMKTCCSLWFETFKHWEFIKRLLLLALPGLLLNQIVVRYADDTLRFSISDELYVYQILMAAIECFSICVAVPAFIAVGRKFTIIILYAIATIAYFGAYFTINLNIVYRITLLVVARMMMQVAHSGICIMTAETFPTVCRSTVVGFVYAISAIGSMASIPLYTKVSEPNLYLVYLVFNLVSLLSIAMVPHTRSHYILDTYEDAETYQASHDEYSGYKSILKCFKTKY